MSGSGRLVRSVVLVSLLASGGWTAGCLKTGGALLPSTGADEEIWAIRCITLQGPQRFKRADAYAAALKKVPGLKPELVLVLSDEDGSTVFYGRYQREYGPEGDAERYRPDHLRDLETIRALRFQKEDIWPFILASMDLLPTYRPAHPEWNLGQAEGYWALHIAVFYNTDEMRARRSAAEEYCRLLRAQGEPAYYHHGVVNSSVCIGTYPQEAVSEIRRDDPIAGRVIVASTIVDSQMLEAQKRFPTSTQNGFVVYDIKRDPTTGAVKERIPAASFPVVIPRAQPAQPPKGP